VAQPRVELPALASVGKARPIDDGPKDPSLAAFRDTLLAIAARRDSAALHARIASTVKYSFGDSEGGPRGLFAYWHTHESMDKLWVTLADVLQHGGRLPEAESFYAPWTFQALPDSLDAFEYLIVRDSGVVVRARPDVSDPGFGTLTYDIVKAGGERADSAWRGIRLPDNRVGYVEARSIRSPVEWRIGMRRSGREWKIDFFVAGD
jgi:hypothetical protein